MEQLWAAAEELCIISSVAQPGAVIEAAEYSRELQKAQGAIHAAVCALDTAGVDFDSETMNKKLRSALSRVKRCAEAQHDPSAFLAQYRATLVCEQPLIASLFDAILRRKQLSLISIDMPVFSPDQVAVIRAAKWMS